MSQIESYKNLSSRGYGALKARSLNHAEKIIKGLFEEEAKQLFFSGKYGRIMISKKIEVWQNGKNYYGSVYYE